MGCYPMILVSILEGKNFPVRHDKKLIVEAKFDGEVMGTEPVPHVTYPQIQTEFGWEVDKKGLQMHRLQRTPIKLLWYAVDSELMRKESIGYIILDIRLAHETDLAATWYPLLNCKYQREKPEVLIRLGLEKENSPRNQKEISGPKDNGFNGSRTYTVGEMKDLRRQHSAESNSKVPVPSLPAPSSLSNALEPVLLPESCCYRIGPPELCRSNFSFSVTLAFAANLNKLAHPSPHCSSKEFYFYYSLFENDVTTGRFTSLLNPDFRAERASVKISSSSELLSSYFKQHSKLEVFLYSGDVPLASGSILLNLFASVMQHNIDKEPLCIEDNVKLHPIEKHSKVPASEDLSPFVGVTVVLQKDVEQRTTETLVSPPKVTNSSAQAITKLQQLPSSQCDNVGNLAGHGQIGDETNGNHMIGKDHSDGHMGQNRSKAQFQRHHSLTEGKGDPTHSTYSMQNKPYSKFGRNTATHALNGNHYPANDNVPCHFCFSLEICNFRATRLEHPVNVFIRYTYPFFGGSTMVVTHPEVEVYPGSMVSIPAGYCSFNFATTLGALKATFYESPLMLEVCHRKSQSPKSDQLIGNSRLNLYQIFNSSVVPHMENKKQSKRQMCTCKVSVVTAEGREVGELTATIALDDFGPTSPACDTNAGKLKTPVFPQLRNSLSSFDVPSMRQNGYTQDDLLQAAYDIERWKEHQRQVFRAELKEREMQHLKVIITEWKQREAERELAIQRRMSECQTLEDKLKQLVEDAEIKEKQLAAQEKELNIRLQNVSKQIEQHEKEMSLQIEKLRIEYEDLIRIERLKRIELEESISSLQRKIHEKDAEIHEQRNIIESLKVHANKQPDVELKTEVNILKMEKGELQQKFEAATASKQKYKLQWSQALRQVAVLQQRLRAQERSELSSLQQQHMLRNGDEKQSATSLGDSSVLTKITEKHSSKEDSELEQDSPSSQSTMESLPATTPSTTAGEARPVTKTQQLISHRDNLLKSGKYKDTDHFIRMMNSFIEKAK